MIRTDGYGLIVDEWGSVTELTTLKCGHCQRQIIFGLIGQPEPNWGHCKSCDHPVCEECYTKMMTGRGCQFFMYEIDKVEEEYYRRTQNDKCL